MIGALKHWIRSIKRLPHLSMSRFIWKIYCTIHVWGFSRGSNLHVFGVVSKETPYFFFHGLAARKQGKLGPELL